jgi:hypothetical protein
MGTATAALAKARDSAPTVTCRYSLWVPEADAQDRTAAFRRWGDTILARGFEVAVTPVIESVEHDGRVEWYVRGGVTPTR